MSSIQEPKFTKNHLHKISNRKIGTILDDVGAKPFYNKEINQWMYPGVMELHTAQELSLKITLGNIMKMESGKQLIIINFNNNTILLYKINYAFNCFMIIIKFN